MEGALQHTHVYMSTHVLSKHATMIAGLWHTTVISAIHSWLWLGAFIAHLHCRPRTVTSPCRTSSWRSDARMQGC